MEEQASVHEVGAAAGTYDKIKILIEEKFKELDSDQIEGGEFEFLGLETRFERNKRLRFWRSIFYC